MKKLAYQLHSRAKEYVKQKHIYSVLVTGSHQENTQTAIVIISVQEYAKQTQTALKTDVLTLIQNAKMEYAKFTTVKANLQDV